MVLWEECVSIMTEEQTFVLADEESFMFLGGALHFTTPSIYDVPQVVDAFGGHSSISLKALWP